MLFTTTLLTACGGGGGGSGSGADNVDRAAPEASIQFPPPAAMVDAPIITVRGTARDRAGNAITAVRVNGVDVTTNDNFANWQVTLPLDPGSNTLAVETEDALGNATSSAATTTVQARAFPFLTNPTDNGMVVDAANNRALVLQSFVDADALYAFDLSTGERTVLSSTGGVDNFLNTAAVGSGADLQLPEHLQLDAANNRVLLIDAPTQTILTIDLNTGERSLVLSLAAQGGSGPAFTRFRSTLLDADNNRLLIMDGFNGGFRLMAVNLGNKARTILSSSGVGSGPTLNASEPMALDSANNRLLVADAKASKGVLLAINLANGNRTVISGFNSQNSTTVGSGALFTSPQSLRFDSERNAVLIADSGTASLFMVDLATGTRTVVSGTDPDTRQPVGAGPTFDVLRAAEFLGDHQAVVEDREMETLLVVDLLTGDRELLPANAIGSGPRLETPHAFALQGNRLLVADSEINALMAIDATSGDRSVFMDGKPHALLNPSAIVLDKSGRRTFLLDNVENDPRLLSVDLASQQVTVISSLNGADAIGTGPQMSLPTAMALDAARNRMLVLDLNEQALFAVDLASGDRTVQSGFDSVSATTIGSGTEFGFPTAMVMSPDGNTVFVTDSGEGTLVAVDVVSGDRSTVTSQNSDLVETISIALDKEGNRAFIGNVNGESIVTVALATGTVTTLTGFGNDAPDGRGAGPELNEPVSIIVDDANNRLLVLDSAVRGVFTIDLVSGDRVISSWTDISPQNNLF